MEEKSEAIRKFIIEQVGPHPRDVARLVSETFGISRQAVNRHLRNLMVEGLLTAHGNTRSREYSAAVIVDVTFALPISKDLQEDQVWRERVRPALEKVKPNVIQICQYGFTEILNNAIDHSGGTLVWIQLYYTAAQVQLRIEDDGVGIFNKITDELHLDDKRHAILELAKGKLTTDPAHHTGEGIFFTSRAFDRFSILSGGLYFVHASSDRDWLLEEGKDAAGTCVSMEISNTSERTLKEVFDRYTVGEDYGFDRTIVPVALAQIGDENLVSRSQAKRLLARFDRFKEVLLDFRGVQAIGQGFADEIFRVFKSQHPNVNITWISANDEVEKMITRTMC